MIVLAVGKSFCNNSILFEISMGMGVKGHENKGDTCFKEDPWLFKHI
jgi:hypothetical protein